MCQDSGITCCISHTMMYVQGVDTNTAVPKLYAVPGRSSKSTLAASTDAEMNSITVAVPPCLLGTPLAEELVSRILHERWNFELKKDIDPASLTPTPLAQMQTYQRRLRKETDNPSRTCETCQRKTRIKCQGCKEVYYCNIDCQKANWKQHKKKCKMPPLSIQEQVLIAVPDFDCFWQYQHALIAVSSDEHVGISVMSRDRFAEMFGDDAAKRTLTTLATTGKPFQCLTRVFGQVGCSNNEQRQQESR